MAGFPPGAAHGQPRLPRQTLIGSEPLSNSFFDTFAWLLCRCGNLLNHLTFLPQNNTRNTAQVADCRDMPQAAGDSDRGDRISLTRPDLERRQPARPQQPRRRR